MYSVENDFNFKKFYREREFRFSYLYINYAKSNLVFIQVETLLCINDALFPPEVLFSFKIFVNILKF